MLIAAPLLSDSKLTVNQACGSDPKLPCRIAWQISPDAAKSMHGWSIDTWTNKLVAIIFTIMLALIMRRFAHGLITKVTVRMSEGTVSERLREKTKTIFDGSPALLSERRRQRAETMGSLLRSIASVVILGIAAFTALGQLGLNLAPVLASAGILGVAVAFGAQNLVKDFLTGIFMLLEDQYGVGDVIDVGPAKGTVESVTLRITKLRDVNGVAWYVRNGEIQRVGNESQNWARVVLDVPVTHDQKVERVEEVLKDTADAMAAEPPWDEKILEEPSVWGVQELTNSSVVVRVTLKTAPGEQGRVARELRARVKVAFDEAGVAMAAAAEK